MNIKFKKKCKQQLVIQHFYLIKVYIINLVTFDKMISFKWLKIHF